MVIRNAIHIVFALTVVATGLTGCSDSKDAQSLAEAEGVSPADAAAVEAHPGEQIYDEYCFSCHAPGLNGAPKLGDVEAWAPRIAKGPDLLLAATIEGIPPAMPPRGICMACSDEELAAAIDYMVIHSQ